MRAAHWLIYIYTNNDVAASAEHWLLRVHLLRQPRRRTVRYRICQLLLTLPNRFCSRFLLQLICYPLLEPGGGLQCSLVE
jgi:hypothetical protein